MDLKGKLVFVGSARGADKQKIVSEIRHFGKPVLFATDVTPVPEYISKMSAIFNTRIFEPQRDITEKEKILLSKGFAFENLHERDAIASTVKAFHVNQNKFRKIEAALKSKKMDDKTEQVKGLVLEGFSVQNALLDLDTKIEIETVPEKQGEAETVDPSLLKKNEKIREVLRANAELKKAIERAETEKKILQDKLLNLEKGIYERIVRDKEIRKRDTKIRIMSKKKKRREKQSNLKALKNKKEKEKKVDLDKIIKNYRRKSSDR